jgi:hypothetical protein
VEADPFLCSMVESALENGRFFAKDISLSIGTKPLDPKETQLSASAAARVGGDVSMMGQFNLSLSSADRSSALSSINAPFVKFMQHITVEVDYEGLSNPFVVIYLCVYSHFCVLCDLQKESSLMPPSQQRRWIYHHIEGEEGSQSSPLHL